MTGMEDVLRAELAREAANLDFAPREEAWAAIEQRAKAGAGGGSRIRRRAGTRRSANIRRGGHIGHDADIRYGADIEPARQRRHGWLMVAGSAAAVVVTVVAATYAGGVYGRGGQRGTPGPVPGSTGTGSTGGGATPGAVTPLPRGVVRIAPPPGQPGIPFYAWSLTLRFLVNPADLKAGMTPAQIAKLPSRPDTEVCVADQPPPQPPAGTNIRECPTGTFFEFRVDHTPRIGFPISGGDAWIGSATANISSVEARYADGRVVRGSIVTVPGTKIRIWELGLAGPQRVGSPLPDVNLVVRDARGKFLGQGTLSASLPSQFPFALHGTPVQLFPFQTGIEAVITASGKYAVFGYYAPFTTGNMVESTSTAYPLPTKVPIQGELGMLPDYLHPWWFGLARADVAKIVVRLADGRTMQATCPSPAPAPVIPSRIPHGGGSLASKHLVSTCAAIPGAPGGERAFALQLPQEFYRKTNAAALPHGTATAYDAAGKVLAAISLGTVFTH